ncbi:MAG TPA: metallophosphoesterase [Stellaceae bacterium]|nr:metallophosphoesterase [Stellaceae bacterium]
MKPDVPEELTRRLGRLHARQRLGIERAYEARVFRKGINFFHIENWYSIHSVIRAALRLAGLYGRGRRNAARVELRRNTVVLPELPPAFDGFTLLHLTDLHVEMNSAALQRVVELLADVSYDVAVLTGDFRAQTYGPYEAVLDGLRWFRPHLKGPVYGVLGNHDTVRMVPAMEQMGIRMLLNEVEVIRRGDQRIHLVGVDDAHYYRVDNIEKAAGDVPHDEFSILLTHTPEIYRQAAHADFNFLLSGHTHGGQICLPGGTPIILDAKLPRKFGAGAWQYEGMHGYTSRGCGTSLVPVRLNCPPEITLHHLRRA